MIAVWSSDRLGRSMSHLMEVLETIKGTGVGLYIHTQALDTTTPAGRAMFQMLGMFAEFEREMIRERVNSRLDRVRGQIDRTGRYATRDGKTIRRPWPAWRGAAQDRGRSESASGWQRHPQGR
jgi:DNA invertase Pin-like site-specific DNA recombinase